MLVWRLSRRANATLDGEGARRVGGRWTSRGKPAVYTSGSPSLALLEVLVHLDLPSELMPDDYCLLKIEVPDNVAVESIDHAAIASSAFDFLAAGDGWLAAAKSAVLVVPSVIVPQQQNYILNPAHPAAAHIAIIDIEPFRIDDRLLES
jgi:RES domain-containing protein